MRVLGDLARIAKTGEDFEANKRLQKCRMVKLWQFRQGHPKPACSEKVQRGNQGKSFKNRPKSSLRLKGPKALWRKWHYPLFFLLFKVQTMENIFAQTAAPEVPEWPSYGNFREVIQNPNFLKKCKGETK